MPTSQAGWRYKQRKQLGLAHKTADFFSLVGETCDGSTSVFRVLAASIPEDRSTSYCSTSPPRRPLATLIADGYSVRPMCLLGALATPAVSISSTKSSDAVCGSGCRARCKTTGCVGGLSVGVPKPDARLFQATDITFKH